MLKLLPQGVHSSEDACLILKVSQPLDPGWGLGFTMPEAECAKKENIPSKPSGTFHSINDVPGAWLTAEVLSVLK